jgi:putative ABC transport system ATP-binding protein
MKDIKIQMQNITKVFEIDNMETHALRGIDLTIRDGEYISISGPSGCGKSTLLSILGLLDQPTSGSYMIEGDDASQLSLANAARIRANKVGFIFQQFNLIDELTVFENIALPLRYSDEQHSESVIKEKVDHCLASVEMGHRAGHYPNLLSGGQQQRIAIARSLVASPAILLVDEPTGNLDSKNGDAIMDMLEKLNDEGTTICLVTHDPRYANRAKSQYHLLDGQIELVKSNAEAV